MSDFAASAFDASAELAPAAPSTSSFDVTSVEQNLKTVSAIEQRWRLPAVPEMVKLDLAADPTQNPQSLTDFLLGLDDDLNGEVDDSDPLDGVDTSGLDTTRSASDQFLIAANDVVGNPIPPTELDVDAVKRFKIEAIGDGALEAPADGVVDNAWSPELNRIRNDRIYSELDSFYAGNRVGAVSTPKMLEILGDWTQPSGLLAAATELDLFWDFGNISSEFSSWGDKWRAVADSDGPLDFGKNLLDAVTGPVDDIVFPALNILTLSTGVGVLANSARIGVLAGRAANSGRMMRGIYSSARMLAPSSAASIAETSWMAGRLAQRSGVLGATGSAMQAWRALPSVVKTKQGVQIGMRAGFLSQAQDLVPGYQGGLDLTSIDSVEQGREGLRNFGLNSPLATVPELMFAPFNIFNPGTFVGKSGVLSSAGKGFVAAGGTIPGRAALGFAGGTAVGTLTGDDLESTLAGGIVGGVGLAALPQVARGVGALPGVARGGLFGAGLGAGVAVVSDDVDLGEGLLFGSAVGASLVPASSVWSKVPNPSKWVGHATDVVQRLNYRPIADDQRVGLAFQRGMRAALADSPEGLERWETLMTETGSFRRTMGEFFGMDDDSVGAAVTFTMVAAAIDHTAATQAGGRMGDQFHIFRNRLISQLRTFDPDSPTLMEEVARATAIDRTFGDHTKMYERTLAELALNPDAVADLAARHNDVAAQTLNQLTSLDNLPDLADSVRVGPWQQAGSEERIGILEAYLPNVMDTFGNWPKFSSQSLTVEGWVTDGLLDGATFAKVDTPFGTQRNVKAEIFKIKDPVQQATDEMTDTLIRDPLVRQRAGSNVAPLARLQPSGRFTMARTATVSKQELERTAYELEDLITAAEKLKFLSETGVRKRIADTGQLLGDLDENAVKQFIRANGFGKNDSQIRYIHSFMRRHGISDAQLSAVIDDQIESLISDAAMTQRFGLDAIARDSEGNVLRGIEALKARRKALLQKARYTAAEVDIDETVANIRATRGDAAADELAAQFELMAGDGYKLVHGVEYLMPHDLATKSVLFRDHGVRELNAATMGNFFSRQEPAVARVAQERRERSALVNALAKSGLGDFAPDAPEIDQALGDLRGVLMSIQDPIAQAAEERHLMNFWEKFRNAQESAFAPLRIEDLTRHRGRVIRDLRSLGWTDEQAEAIFSGIRNFRNTDFDSLGLYALEAKVRTKNLNVSALKWTSNTGFWSTAGKTAAGAYIGNAVAGEDGAVAGALVGSVGGYAAARAVNRNDWVSDALLRAEQRSGWQIGDRLARLRDGMRFSLSPMFDISRYTEGLVLGRTGTPLRHADGSRVLLPSNLSPTATKKRLGQVDYDGARNTFKAIAKGRGAGDLDVLDDAGHWFSQIGIMGFNPMEWQVSAFAELRRAGFGAEEAYGAARATQTYGMKGRSAAELSTNFVFFPFSFQKKVLTHIGQFLNDDLGRSILIHDGFAAYQALDERYNLDEFWQDHIPALEQIQRLNVLAYGASAGRFGGINSQLFETSGKALLLFSPIAVNVKGEEDWVELERLMTSVMPAINDINWMTREVQEAYGTYSAGTFQLPSAQVRDGYAEWNNYREEVDQFLSQNGFSWYDLHNRPWLQREKLAYEAKIAELQRKYPSWAESRIETVQNINALQMERRDLIRQATAAPETATSQAVYLAEMEAFIDQVKEQLGFQGVSVDGRDGWLDAPPWAFNAVRERAVQLAQTDPRFISVWNTFFLKELGPIEAPR